MKLTKELRYAGRTNIGRKRQSNQDQFLAAQLTNSLTHSESSLEIDANSLVFGVTQSYLFLVADGMGGHQAGNKASDLAIKYIVSCILSSRRWVMSPSKDGEKEFSEFLKDLLTAAHRTILDEASANKDWKGMGTTLTMAYVVWPKMWIVHAGDTRCYLLRNSALTQLTRDHTLANQMVLQGLLSPELTERSPWSNVLWNALGASSPEVVADIHQVELQEGDRILLCSDGLNKHLANHEIQSLLNCMEPPATTCDTLIDRANELGGSDNITTIVADLFPNDSQEIASYRAQRTTGGDEVVARFIDYTLSQSGTTTDEAAVPGDANTADF